MRNEIGIFLIVLFSSILTSCDSREKKKNIQNLTCADIVDSVYRAEEAGNVLKLREFVHQSYSICGDDFWNLYFVLVSVHNEDRESYLPYWKKTLELAHTSDQLERLLYSLSDYLGDDPFSKETNYFITYFTSNPPVLKSETIAKVYHEVGMILYFQGRYSEALEYQKKGLLWMEENAIPTNKNIFYSNVFFSALELRDFELCERVMKKGELNFEAKLDSVRMITLKY